jgi:hypothetical protein
VSGKVFPLSDRELVNWLAARNYVEATDQGNDDPNQFQFHQAFSKVPFREALSNHINGKRSRTVVDNEGMEQPRRA